MRMNDDDCHGHVNQGSGFWVSFLVSDSGSGQSINLLPLQRIKYLIRLEM